MEGAHSLIIVICGEFGDSTTASFDGGTPDCAALVDMVRCDGNLWMLASMKAIKGVFGRVPRIRPAPAMQISACLVSWDAGGACSQAAKIALQARIQGTPGSGVFSMQIQIARSAAPRTHPRCTRAS